MTDYDFLDFEESQTIKLIDKHLIVVIMSCCMAYFALFLFNKMLILSN
jgi:hypothetical protein